MKAKELLKNKVLWGSVCAGLLAMTYFVDPALNRWAPKCPFLLLTGLKCPGCGIQRATYTLLHGNVGEAWAYNRFLIYSLPYLLSVMLTEWVWTGERQQRWRRVTEGRTAVTIYVTLFFVWGIARNLLDI